MKKRVEIVCSACGEDTLLRREPVYDGFKKSGERLTCTSCGHEYASEDDVPFSSAATPQLFGLDDRSPALDIFATDEGSRTCRHCDHYIVNPFTQRCGLHTKTVNATDFCDDFKSANDGSGDTQDSPT